MGEFFKGWRRIFAGWSLAMACYFLWIWVWVKALTKDDPSPDVLFVIITPATLIAACLFVWKPRPEKAKN